jgi:hypothetical protein
MRIVYKIMLSGQGDWFMQTGVGIINNWVAIQNFDKASIFATHSAAKAKIKELHLKNFWPEVNVQSVGVADTASVA